MGEHSRTPEERRQYWRDVAERLVRAFAQGMLAALGIGTATFDKGGLPWIDALYIGLGSAVISLLMSLAGGQFGDKDSASFQKNLATQPGPGGTAAAPVVVAPVKTPLEGEGTLGAQVGVVKPPDPESPR
jgi:hypothetical protein